LYANIHKDNADYSGILQTIETYRPDVLMFVEFSDHHYDQLKPFLQTNYPYTNSTTWSKRFVGSMVFSKYPITNLADDFPQGMWRYGYFSLAVNGVPYYMYLVHTSSPDSYAHFVMRNEQLSSFTHDFTLHEAQRTHDNLVLVGDFNITPWSAYYPAFADVFSGQMSNITEQVSVLFTRRLFYLPLVWSHIDHLWASTGLVQDFRTVYLPGSDHRGFVFTLKKTP
jgi:endonuclease/exonuclease/phosphatase (EEP) superfamily protein YafD